MQDKTEITVNLSSISRVTIAAEKYARVLCKKSYTGYN